MTHFYSGSIAVRFEGAMPDAQSDTAPSCYPNTTSRITTSSAALRMLFTAPTHAI